MGHEAEDTLNYLQRSSPRPNNLGVQLNPIY